MADDVADLLARLKAAAAIEPTPWDELREVTRRLEQWARTSTQKAALDGLPKAAPDAVGAACDKIEIAFRTGVAGPNRRRRVR